MQMLVSSRYRGSATLQSSAIPIEHTLLEHALFWGEGLEAGYLAGKGADVDLARRSLGWLHHEAARFLAHQHLGTFLDAQRLGQSQRHRVSRLEHLGAI